MIHVHPPRREPSGRRQRPTGALAQQIDRERREAERQSAQAVALAQPHRRGSDDPLCESQLGRFCKSQKLDKVYYDAGLAYADVVRRWRVANCIPVQLNVGVGSGNDPADKTVEQWDRQLEEIKRALSKNSIRAYLAVRHLVIDDAELPPEAVMWGRSGLMLLADYWQMPVGRHPYRP